MLNLRPFQIFLLAFFTFIAIFAVIYVRVRDVGPSTPEVVYGQVEIWGSLSQTAMQNLINQVKEDDDFDAVFYKQVDERSFDAEFINAIAEGRSPDLIIFTSDSLVKHRSKLSAIEHSANTITRRNFQNYFVNGAEIFMLPEGFYAVPLVVDPLIMYWNRDMFAAAGVAEPPATWETLVNGVLPRLTKRDVNRNILQSAVALGEYRNITNAKAILVTLLMQSGSRMVEVDNNLYDLKLNASVIPDARPPMEAALQFYTDFANASSPLYTWNRAQPDDKNAFIAQDLAIYFGLGSEAEDLASKNPNLNFDVASIPQGAGATTKRVYGDIYGFAIPKTSDNREGAFNAAIRLATPDYSQSFATEVNMSSAFRSVIGAGDANPYRQILLDSALVTYSWLDPDPIASDEIFEIMVEDVVSNRQRLGQAVNDAINRLEFEY